MKTIFTLLLPFVFLCNIYAQSGTLDSSFGNGGKVFTSIGSWAEGRAMALQTDGKILVAGYAFDGTKNNFALVRYNIDGSLDVTFDGDGKVTTAFGAGGDYATAIAIQSDGKIVVAGYSFNGMDDDFALARYNLDGTLDMSFNEYGKVTTPVGSEYDFVNAVQIQSNGKIVVAGSTNTGGISSFALARYNTNGALDAGFGNNGITITHIGSVRDNAFDLRIQADGKLLVTGTTYNGNNCDFALVRYNSNGELDNSFNYSGIVTLAIGSSNDYANAMELQKDGKIIVAGKSFNAGNYDFAMARFSPDGSLDTSFNGNGKVITSFGLLNDEAFAPLVQSDGKIMLAGTTGNGSSSSIALARYNSNGSLDISFDGDGRVTTSVGQDNGYAYSVKQYANRIYVAGSSNNGTNENFAVIAYLNDANVLPLNLLRFSAVLNASAVQCSWQTANEMGTSHFIVQRSVDGIYFNNVARINAAGMFPVSSYNYSDELAEFGLLQSKLYYRLQIIDKDGKTAYSGVSVVFNRSASDFSISPNPVSNILHIHGSSLKTLRLIDRSGKIILIKTVENSGPGTLNVASLAKGIYILQVINNNGYSQTTSFIKQ